MSLILAIESDRRQGALLSTLRGGPRDVELVVGATTEAAFATIGTRVPDLVLASALLSPEDGAELGVRLRQFDAAGVHVQTLAIPILRAGGSDPGDEGDRRLFATHVAEFLERAAADRAALAAAQADLVALWAEDPRTQLTRPVTSRHLAVPELSITLAPDEQSEEAWEDVSLEPMENGSNAAARAGAVVPAGYRLEPRCGIHAEAVDLETFDHHLGTVPVPDTSAAAARDARFQTGWQDVLSAIRRDIQAARGDGPPQAPRRPQLDFSMDTLVFPPRPAVAAGVLARLIPVPQPQAVESLAPVAARLPDEVGEAVAEPVAVTSPERASALPPPLVVEPMIAAPVVARPIPHGNEPTPPEPPAADRKTRRPEAAARPARDWGLLDSQAVGFGSLMARLKAIAGRDGALPRP